MEPGTKGQGEIEFLARVERDIRERDPYSNYMIEILVDNGLTLCLTYDSPSDSHSHFCLHAMDLGYHSTTTFENKYWTRNQKGKIKVKHKHIRHEKEIQFQ